MRRYANRRVPDKSEGAERLFWTNQLLVATDYYDARVGSVTARPDDFLPWRSIKPIGIEHTRAANDEVCGEIGKAPGTELVQQEVLAAGLLRPAYLLDAMRSFTVYMTTDDGVRIKVVPRYQQFRSVHIALQRLREGKNSLDETPLQPPARRVSHATLTLIIARTANDEFFVTLEQKISRRLPITQSNLRSKRVISAGSR